MARKSCGAVASGVPGARGTSVTKRDYAWIICLEDDPVYVGVQWREDEASCKALTTLRANLNFKAIRERGGGEPLVPRKKMTG